MSVLNPRSEKMMKLLVQLSKKNNSNVIRLIDILDTKQFSKRDTLTICKFLDENGYVKTKYLEKQGYDGPVIGGYILLEPSVSYREFSRKAVKEYFIDNWIAIAALIVATISLVISFCVANGWEISQILKQ